MSSPVNNSLTPTSVLLEGYHEGQLSIQEILLGIFEQGRIIAARLERVANAIVGYPVSDSQLTDSDVDSYTPLPTLLHALAYEQRRASQALNALELTAPPRGPRQGISIDEGIAPPSQPKEQAQPQCQGRRRR